jgi:tetratricopeptide (TPR) repeat protein
MCRLPWRSIYTVNFDDLIEKAFALDRPGELEVFVSAHDLERRDVKTTPLMMLHGSIKKPLDRDMGLVLTQEDFRRSMDQRRAFYHALTDDMQVAEILCIGFGMADEDFRHTVNDLHAAVDGRLELLPRAYALIPNPPPFAANYWGTKKISVVATTLEAFVEAVNKVAAGKSTVQAIPIGSRPLLPSYLAAVNPAAPEADDLAWAFEFPELDTGEPDPLTFLHGGPISWPTVRERFDAPRAVTDDMLVQLVISPADESGDPAPGSTKFVLLSGSAGAGKTTLAKRAAWDLQANWGRAVAWTRHPSRLQLDVVETLVSRAKRRVYVFVDNGADAALQVVDVIRRARRRGLRVTFIVSERLNEWAAATRDNPAEPDRLFEIGTVTDLEANAIIDTLERAGQLGTLRGLSRPEQVSRLVVRAERQLLVGLREATEDGKRFDEIIEDEFNALPTEAARRAYMVICTLYQFNVATRAGVLSRATGVPFDKFASSILQPSRGVILEHQAAPWEQPAYQARHRVIAEVVFRRAFRTPEDRAVQVMSVLQQLDLGYREDQRAFARLTSWAWLREIGVTDPAPIYRLARRLRPNDPFVVQQEALSWRFRNPSMAATLLSEAAKMAPTNLAISHSRAVLLADEAKNAPSGEQAERFAEAEKQFRKLISRDPANSASYVSLADMLIDRAKASDDPAEQMRLLVEAEQTIDKSFAVCPVTFQLLGAAGRLEAALGNLPGAEDDYRRAASTAGTNPLVWINLGRFLAHHGKVEEAITVLNDAIDANPTHARLNYELALIGQASDRPNDVLIRRAFAYAVAEPVRGHLPELDFAIYLHRRADYGAAQEHFANLRALPLPYRLKAAPRAWVEIAGQRSKFDAVLSDLRFRSAYVRVPSYAEPIYLDPGLIPSGAKREGSQLEVYLLYNCFGLKAVPTSGTAEQASDEAYGLDASGQASDA